MAKLNKDNLRALMQIMTTDYVATARLPVDAQQTSFEENHQFRFFDELEIPSTEGYQLVYKVTATNPFVLFNRTISFWQGGATYRIYAVDGSHTFTGTLADTGWIGPVNGDLSESGLPEHPTTTIALQMDEGVGIFVPGSAPRTGTSVRAGTNAQQSSGALGSDSVRLGFPSDFSAWIVMEHLSGINQTSHGEYELYFEERYP